MNREDYINSLFEEIEELKKQIESYKETLSFEKDVIHEGLFTELKEAEAQIEKMKCCGNCKYWLDEDEMDKLPEELQLKYQVCPDARWYERCQEWELAE